MKLLAGRRPFSDYVGKNLYVTASGMFSDTYLQRSIETVGTDRILFLTDYPCQYRPGQDARRLLERLTLDTSGKEKFVHVHWERLACRV